MSETITQLKTEYDKKVKEIQDLMKNPNRDAGLFSVDIGFKDKNLHFANQGGVITSSVDKLKNYPFKGYPYKREVKLSFDDTGEYEPCVEAGGGADLYGICVDIDEFTGTATVMPITNNFTGYLVVKQSGQSSITVGGKVKFDSNGEIEKSSSNIKINTVALSDAIELDSEKKLCIVHVAIYGNKGKPS